MGKSIKVLVVEDSEDDAQLVIREIRRGGYDPIWERVDNAGTLSMALDKLWEIVLSDWTMPGFEGIQALKLLKEKNIDIPFIIVTGTVTEELAVTAMKAGAHDYVMKGNLKRLVPAIERELQEARSRLERRRLEEEHKKMQEQLIMQDRLASIGQLVSGVAHEINNPLTGIIGFSDLLLERKLPDDIRADIQIVNDEAKRTAQIVKNLLTFARKQPQEKQAININEAIQVVLRLRAHDHSVNNIHMTTDYGSNLPSVLANGSQLQQVFLNLIVNAEQAMLEFSKKGTLTISTELAGDFVRASFEDDGPGISKENMPRLFTPFFTTKGVGKGTGLGLSISHGIITEHGGKIYVESQPGKGARFVVDLPADVSNQQADQK